MGNPEFTIGNSAIPDCEPTSSQTKVPLAEPGKHRKEVANSWDEPLNFLPLLNNTVIFDYLLLPEEDNNNNHQLLFTIL